MPKKALAEMAKEALPSHSETVFPLAKFSEGLPLGFYFCTLPLETPEQQQQALYQIELATNRLIDVDGEVLHIRDVMVRNDWEEDPKTGEIVKVKRLFLFDSEGRGWSTPSEPARKSLARQLQRLAQLSVPRIPPYDPPLPILVRREKNRDTTKAPWLHLVVTADADITPSRGS